MGVQITWLQPYRFNQRLPFDVDYKIMGTFLEFYQALLKFANFKLFADIGQRYPLGDSYPQSKTSTYLDPALVKKMQSHVQKLSDAADQEALTNSEFMDAPEMQQITQRSEQLKKQRKLLANCNFWMGRETPVYILQYLILSFGGSYVLQDDEPSLDGVTHICMDRIPASLEKGKEYVQPQYIVDCQNNLFLLPTKPYLPGQPAPPHLSPFVDNEAQAYIPDR